MQFEIHFKNISSAMEAPSTCTPHAARIRSTPGRRSSITSPEDQQVLETEIILLFSSFKKLYRVKFFSFLFLH